MSQLFQITQENPNDAVGGGGTICSGDSQGADCKPPYAVFYTVETDNNLSPHVVLCASCAAAVVRKAEEAEQERQDFVDSTAVEDSDYEQRDPSDEQDPQPTEADEVIA